MIVSLKGKTFDFTVEAPPSKSIYHRELIVRFLLGDTGNLEDKEGDNDDCLATKACLRALLLSKPGEDVLLPCKESGSTLRFMIPVASAFLLREGKAGGNRLIFSTEGRLFDRPLAELEDALRPHGITITKDEDTRTIIASGIMTPGRFVIDGSVSSQYISGLLMAAVLFDEDFSITVTGGMKSVHYIELTQDVLAKYGIASELKANTYTVDKTNVIKPEGGLKVEGDWSNGAFLLCLKALIRRGDINVTGLNMDSRQGDTAILSFLDEAKKTAGKKEVFSCRDIPDIVPYMAVTSAFFFDKAVFEGISRLRIKECDRVMAVRDQLERVGVKTEETEDSLTVYGIGNREIDEVIFLPSYHDHRMAMTAVLLAAALDADVDIDDIECVNKSFPQLQDLIRREMMP